MDAPPYLFPVGCLHPMALGQERADVVPAGSVPYFRPKNPLAIGLGQIVESQIMNLTNYIYSIYNMSGWKGTKAVLSRVTRSTSLSLSI